MLPQKTRKFKSLVWGLKYFKFWKKNPRCLFLRSWDSTVLTCTKVWQTCKISIIISKWYTVCKCVKIPRYILLTRRILFKNHSNVVCFSQIWLEDKAIKFHDLNKWHFQISKYFYQDLNRSDLVILLSCLFQMLSLGCIHLELVGPPGFHWASAIWKNKVNTIQNN